MWILTTRNELLQSDNITLIRYDDEAKCLTALVDSSLDGLRHVDLAHDITPQAAAKLVLMLPHILCENRAVAHMEQVLKSLI